MAWQELSRSQQCSLCDRSIDASPKGGRVMHVKTGCGATNLHENACRQIADCQGGLKWDRSCVADIVRNPLQGASAPIRIIVCLPQYLLPFGLRCV